MAYFQSKEQGNSGPTEYNQFSLARLEKHPSLRFVATIGCAGVTGHPGGGSAEAWKLSSISPRDIGMNVLCQR